MLTDEQTDSPANTDSKTNKQHTFMDFRAMHRLDKWEH